jgi:ATPase subunit of ABC transporter with duplicated ATPase domains
MIQIQNLSLQRGVKELIKQANIEIYPGHKVGVIGANGCGSQRCLVCCAASCKQIWEIV